MSREYFRFTIPDWMKWTLTVTFLLLISCLGYAVYLYQDIQEQRTAQFDKVREEVLSSTELTYVENIERFHGEKAYFVVYGKTSDNKEKIIFYPFDQKQGTIKTVSKSEIIPESKIQAKWNNQCEGCDLKGITPAIVGKNNQLAWELTYTDSNERYVIEYLSIIDGERIEMLGLKQMFK